MTWSDINPFLKKFKYITPPEKAIKDIFISATQQVIDVRLLPHEVKVQRNKILLQTSHVVKNEIFLHRVKILTIVNQTLAGENITDII